MVGAGTSTLSTSGGTGPYTYAIVGTGAGSFGTMTIGAGGTYSYTLTKASTDLAGNETETFTYTVTDALGNTATQTITITIVDDVPAAVADTATVAEGALVSGNVVTDVAGLDTLGADGAAAGGPVTAVNGVTGNVGVAVAGSYGSLTLNADGSYSYQSTPNSVAAGTTATDVFQYTITDGDGDTSTVTLTISIPDGAIETHIDTSVSDQTVDEAALVGGSNPTSPDEVAAGQLAASGGTGPYNYALTGALPAGLAFSGGTLSGTPTAPGSYTVTVQNITTGQALGSFTVNQTGSGLWLTANPSFDDTRLFGNAPSGDGLGIALQQAAAQRTSSMSGLLGALQFADRDDIARQAGALRGDAHASLRLADTALVGSIGNVVQQHQAAMRSGGDADAAATGAGTPVSRGYKEEMEDFAYKIRVWEKSSKAEVDMPRCHGRVAMADAIIALTSNIAMKKKQRIDFKESWFDPTSAEVPDGDTVPRIPVA